jgi:hypothetical protein
MPSIKKTKVTKTVKAKAKTNVSRVALYETPYLELASGDKAITVEYAKKLLGWTVEDDKEKFNANYLLKDFSGKKVRCSNNVTNRPLYMAVVKVLIQEILRKRWRLNGESLIIGSTGLILNGQHTLIALILAGQQWEKDPEACDQWTTEPTIDKAIVFGIDESDMTVNTMDTCKPRSLADVIYRSEFFSGIKAGDRQACARIADYAVRILWHRTGAGLDAFAPRRTHAESLDFIARHPRLLSYL